MKKKYADLICEYLKEIGYTHCFLLTGGNIMHLVESARKCFTIVPVVNEVAAGIAAEYFNEAQGKKKAFVLVTAGPGLTNVVTAMAGAYLESRDLLVIGGQVKVPDLADNNLRQNGIQEIDGVSLVKSITKVAVRLTNTISKVEFLDYVVAGLTPRKGPVFIEIPLDVQACQVEEEEKPYDINLSKGISHISKDEIEAVADMVKSAERPMILLGSGVSRETARALNSAFDKIDVPIVTTWNAADRIDSEHRLYFGRPNTWGQRYSNILLQQSDLLIAVGTRLGLQQTGFNWQEFAPKSKIIHVDCDKFELEKSHPETDIPLCVDANDFIQKLLQRDLGSHGDWINFCQEVKQSLPLDEGEANVTGENYLSPYKFVQILSDLSGNDDVIIPCSSGGAFTVMMQSFLQKSGQVIISNKGLASMGYGLSGSIGAALSFPEKRTILVEGDGGFAQNLQEIATASVNKLNLKIFIFDNNGYASIRMTQRNYFGGKYVGCDVSTGLGFPDWNSLFGAYGVDSMEISDENFINDANFLKRFNDKKCTAFIVKIDPEQTYFPKISSRVKADGGMESNPLHLMSPDLDPEIAEKVFKYI